MQRYTTLAGLQQLHREVSKSTCWTGVISEAEELLLRLGETDMEKKNELESN